MQTIKHAKADSSGKGGRGALSSRPERRRSRQGAGKAGGTGTRKAAGPRPIRDDPIVIPLDRQGCTALLLLRERAGSASEEVSKVVKIDLGSNPELAIGARRAKRRQEWAGGVPKLSAGSYALFGAIGNPFRGQLLSKLLAGPATYRTLQRATKLKAGPLYHHINQLRLVGLILPKQRDLYELTRGGRNLILGAFALGSLVKDKRRRPIPRSDSR